MFSAFDPGKIFLEMYSKVLIINISKSLLAILFVIWLCKIPKIRNKINN